MFSETIEQLHTAFFLHKLSKKKTSLNYKNMAAVMSWQITSINHFTYVNF